MIPFIARRYLFARKRVAAINIISGVSIVGVAIATMALVCTMSVLNGFRDLISSLYTAFDAELQVRPVDGKTIRDDDPAVQKILHDGDVARGAKVFEEHALILFVGRPTVITLRGVDEAYADVVDLRSILYGEGSPQLEAAGVHYGIPGQGLAAAMGGIDFGELEICAPRSGERVNLVNPLESFNTEMLHASRLCFAVNQRKYDESHMLVSLDFAQKLFEKPHEITSLELRLRNGADLRAVQQRLRDIGGERFAVRDRLEQQEEMFSVMQIEKLVSYLFLTLILVVASFNIVGSVTMLVIDKRDDIETLRHIGATRRQVFGIFLLEGWFISLAGAALGLVLGLLLCWVQITFGVVHLGSGSGNFIVEAYPVSVHAADILAVVLTVAAVGLLTSWWPARRASAKLNR